MDSATLRHRCREVGGGVDGGGSVREVAFKERKEKRGRDPVSGRTRSEVAGTDTLNEREEERDA